MRNNTEKKTIELLRRWGYKMRGEDLWEMAIAWVPARRVESFIRGGVFAAADYLIPIIHDDAYHSELIAIREKAIA
jgi:hypothetical protein